MVRQTETGIITMTERAQSKMLDILREKGMEQPELRVFVAGSGGCSGYQYGMSIAEGRKDGDLVVAQGPITLLIDSESAPLVDGAEIDYIEDTMQSGFAINNVNAPSGGGCTCGHGGEPGPSACC
jgi:iron-sulfur cluster assembly accessory protein